MAGLDSLPVEVATCIFQGCDDFPQVIALASTCKTLHSVWHTSSSIIIWEVGKGIRCFDLALMAVRATAIVLKASQAHSPPPPITSMHALSGAAQKPTLAELKEVQNMQHLVRCIEYMYFNNDGGETLFGGSMLPAEFREENCDIDDEEQAESFRSRFYPAIYRLFIGGAVLSRPYMAPFWEAKEQCKQSFLDHSKVFLDEDIDFITSTSWNIQDRDFARQFPVYNYDVEDYSTVGKWREEKYEDIFGPFASWLVREGNNRQFPNLGLEPEGPDIDPPARRTITHSGALDNLMCLLVGYEHLIGKFTNSDGQSKFGRYLDEAKSSPSKTRSVTIILFGVFRVEEVTMPVDFEDMEGCLLPVSIHPTLKGTEQEHSDIPYIIRCLDKHSRSPTAANTSDEHPDPPATFELWHFALRRYLDLGFCDDAFWQWRESMWWSDVGGGIVFHEDPSWAPVQPYEEGKVSWRSTD